MTPIIVILLLIVTSGVFVMAEMALVSARKTRLQQMADEGRSGARIAVELASNPDRFLSTTQVGITLVGILIGAYGERTLTNRLAPTLEQFPRVAPYRETVAFAIVVVLITYLTLVLGELVPKRIGLHHPERIASLMAGFMNFLSRIGAPVVRLLAGSTSVVLKVIRLKPSEEPPVTEEEIKVMMEQGTEAGVFEE